MSLFEISSLLLSLAAAFAYLNYRFIKLPTTIGIMLLSLVLSLALIIFGEMGLALDDHAIEIVSSIDFNKALLHGMLSFLPVCGCIACQYQ